jgi:hypothetical protein
LVKKRALKFERSLEAKKWAQQLAVTMPPRAALRADEAIE